MRTRIFFAHANGFPAPCYRGFLDRLAAEHDVVAPERLGHDPAYPVDREWRSLSDEVLDRLAALPDADPVLAVGHSMGAVLLFLAACRQPRRFAGLTLLDPPMAFGWTGWALKLARLCGRIDRITPAGRSLGRREHWPDRTTVARELGSRPLFREFDDAALQDFVAGGTEPAADGGRRLRFQVTTEVAIFRTIPTELARQPAPLPMPVDLVVASRGSALRRGDRMRFARRHAARLHAVDGDHLFPLSRPHAAASLVLDITRRQLEQAR
jgi:pimeloyl-ACP methyl ester carboxylesterase